MDEACLGLTQLHGEGHGEELLEADLDHAVAVLVLVAEHARQRLKTAR